MELRSWWASAALGGLGCLMTPTMARAMTPACANVTNVASVAFELDGRPATAASNAATTRVGQLLDLQLVASGGAVTMASARSTPIAFALTNAGNGPEAFLLKGAIDVDGATVEGFAVDANGDGKFDPAIDPLIAAGGATAPVAAGAGITVFALVRGGARPTTGTVTVAAEVAIGAGTPGRVIPGRDGACDAVVGGTSASGSASVPVSIVASDPAAVTLVKSQTIVAPNGSSVPVRGATVTYSIESRFDQGGIVDAARLADQVPVGTTYVPGSLKLDGTVLSDADDGDPGRFDGAAVNVALGTVAAPARHTIQFQVIIQ